MAKKTAKEPTEKRPVGRPSGYKPEYCQQLIDFQTQGFSFEAFAGHLGVSTRTVYDWIEQFPEFAHAKDIGLNRSRVFWEKLGVDHIVNMTDSESFGGNMGGQSKSRSLNASIWIFNMKNRFGWRDRFDVQVEAGVSLLEAMDDARSRAQKRLSQVASHQPVIDVTPQSEQTISDDSGEKLTLPKVNE
jgi:hypothetical protein